MGDTGVTVNPRDIDKVSDRLREALTDEDLRLELTEKGLERAKRFTLEKSAEETLNI